MTMAKGKKGGRKAKGPSFSGRFERLRQHFSKHPDSALRTLYADVERMDGLHSYAKTDKFVVESDEPEGIGGTDRAPTPTQLLLASLAHCQAITLRIYSEAMGITIDDLKVKVTGTLDLRGYYSVGDAASTKVPSALQEVVVRTEIFTHETKAKVRELLRATKGRGVCLSSVEKGVRMQFQYRLNGKALKV